MDEYVYPYAKLPKWSSFDTVIFDNFKSDVEYWEGLFVCKKPLLGETHLENCEIEEFSKYKEGNFIPLEEIF